MDLTEKEQEALLNIKKYAALRYYIANGIKSIESVERLIKYQIIPVKASTQRMCNNENHCSQFHYLSEMLLNTFSHTITWANRGGSKTYFLALINWLKSLILPNRECVILGASKEQSLRAYNAMSTFWNIGSYDGFGKPLEADYLDGESLKEHTKYKNKSEVYILAASQKSVSGPHPQSLNLDEVDEMDDGVLEQALSQPQEKNGIPSQLTMSSTNHVAFGNMEMHLERARANENSKIFQWCYDAETEALTRGGWKKISKLKKNDEIISLNPNENQIEWAKIIRLHSYDHNGEMIHFYGNRVDVMVTPEHKMFAKINNNDWGLVRADELIKKKQFKFYRGGNWAGRNDDKIIINNVAYRTKDFLELSGYIISEGCVSQKYKNVVRISQKDRRCIIKIRNCIKRMGLRYREYIDKYKNDFQIRDSNLYKYFLKLGKSIDKYVPEEIKSLSPKLIKIFLDAFALGDGSDEKPEYNFGMVRRIYYTSSKRLASDLGELILKTGKFPSYFVRDNEKSNNPCYRIRETKSKTTRFYKDKGGMQFKKINYSGNVSCPELEKNHVLLIKRNGRCSWQGNCVWETLEACTDYECSTCPLSSFCPGKQMKNATGYYKIKDFLTKLETLSMFTIQVQWFCNKVGAPDLVYKDEFDPDIHLLSNINFNPEKPVHLSIDWGGTHPFALGVYQDYRDTMLDAWVKVDEIYESNADNQHIIKIAKAREWWNYIDPSGMICDPSRSDLRKEWGADTVGVRTKGANNSVDIGLSKVKGALKPVIGRPMIYISNKCQNTIREFSAYKLNKKGKPIQENDHAMDEMRYFIIEKVNPIQKKSNKKPIVFKSDTYSKMNF
jgi:hypothetical protein